jgi:subtilisin family serine protease
MKRAVISLLVLGVAAVAVASASLAGIRGARPVLRLTDGAPLTVRGTHFRAGESVRITAMSLGNAVGRTSAGPGGSFVMRLAIKYNRCSGLTVVARGSKGSRAAIKRPAMDCRP